MREVGELTEILPAIRAIVRNRGHLLAPVKTHKAKDSFASRSQMRDETKLKKKKTFSLELPLTMIWLDSKTCNKQAYRN